MSPTPRLPVPISLLDRSRTREGEAPGTALRTTVERAVRAEALGFRRFWVAEHHAVPGVASGSPPVLMAAIAEQTRRIRVGSGGVMLPNHSPMVVAEQARMLEALHPGRIDLGIGRSLGFTRAVREALGVMRYSPEDFAEHLGELLDLLTGQGPVTAMPSGVRAPPVLVLATGSGLATAARLGLPVVIGGPALRGDLSGIEGYRAAFRPSTFCPEPTVLISVETLIAGSSEQARELALSEAWAMVESTISGAFPPLSDRPPRSFTDKQAAKVVDHLAQSVHGTASEVHEQLSVLVRRTGASEVIAFSSTFDRQALDASDAALAAMAGPVPADS